ISTWAKSLRQAVRERSVTTCHTLSTGKGKYSVTLEVAIPMLPSKPQCLLSPEHRGVPLGVGVIAVLVAAEFLEKADLSRLVPADEGKAVKALDGAVRHGAAESPLHHGLVSLVEMLSDIPVFHGAPGVPLVKP